VAVQTFVWLAHRPHPIFSPPPERKPAADRHGHRALARARGRPNGFWPVAASHAALLVAQGRRAPAPASGPYSRCVSPPPVAVLDLPDGEAPATAAYLRRIVASVLGDDRCAPVYAGKLSNVYVRCDFPPQLSFVP